MDSESSDYSTDQISYPEDNTTANHNTHLDLSDFLDSLWPEVNSPPPGPQIQNPAPKT